MLTRDQAVAEFDFRHGRLVPDRLTRLRHRDYPTYAERMLTIYRHGAGRTRRDLHRSVESVFEAEPECPARRIRAFCKLLDDVSRYDQDRRGAAAELRRQVFHAAARFHPLVDAPDRLFERAEKAVKEQIARQLGRTWTDVERDLFADVVENQRLLEFEGYPDAAALLARYNVGQTQVALFDAESLTIWARRDFKTILRHAKLAGLMHTVAGTPDGGYRIRLDGPASVLRETRRYGTAMAKFLPALLACQDWRLHAKLRIGHGALRLHLDLNSTDGLHSHLAAPDEYDSELERRFAEKWGAEPREGWTLIREGEILWRNQRVFVPDFVFQHADGGRVLLEIVGFWTPEYLEQKLQTLREFPDERLVLAVGESLNAKFAEGATNIIPYKTTLKVSAVLAHLNRPARSAPTND